MLARTDPSVQRNCPLDDLRTSVTSSPRVIKKAVTTVRPNGMTGLSNAVVSPTRTLLERMQSNVESP